MIEIGYGSILEIIFCAVEIVLFRLFLRHFDKCRLKNKGLEILAAVVSAGLMFLQLYFSKTIWARIILALIIYIAYAVVVSEAKAYQYIGISLTYLLMICAIDVGVLTLTRVAAPVSVKEIVWKGSSIGFISAVISKIILFAVVNDLAGMKKTKKDSLVSGNLVMISITSTISFICIYGLFKMEQIHYFEAEAEGQSLMCILALCIFVINLMFFVVMDQLNARAYKQKQYEMVQYKNELLEKVVMENKEVEKQWRKNRHDFNNHLSCIDMLLQMENIPKARAYIQNLTQNYMGVCTSVRLGNEIADAIVSKKMLIAEKKKIKMEIEGSLEENLIIEQMDLCALLSNSLDNAIEAAEKIEDPEKRWINLKLEIYKHYLVIEVENAVKETVANHKKLKTTKKDKKHHGIGMSSMETTVERYMGTLEWKCQENVFKLRMLLPVVKETDEEKYNEEECQ